jgi:uroporphyrinogen decarboxylase
MELFYDGIVGRAIDERCGVTRAIDRSAPFGEAQAHIAMQRFLGYDTVRTSVLALDTQVDTPLDTDDTTEGDLSTGSRRWKEEHTGLITNWEDFERYPWPAPETASLDLAELEWFDKNLPDDMGVIVHGGHFCEYLCWLMGYETLCYALFDQRDLVQAITDRVLELEVLCCETAMQFDCVKMFWGSDDMGFKTGLMVSPEDMRHFVLSGHKRLAQISHDHGRLYLLHACGQRGDIIEDLIEDVKLDAIHSWEDVIEPVTDAKASYGDRLSLLGGIDVDFLTRATPDEVRQRVRDTVETCQPGGGYALGSGNSVANYIPLDNYLAMLDEGRRL